MLFFILKALFVQRYLNFCPDIFGYVGKQLNEKAKVDFKIYGVTTYEKDNYSTRIVR